jgi:hypothetical protein
LLDGRFGVGAVLDAAHKVPIVALFATGFDALPDREGALAAVAGGKAVLRLRISDRAIVLNRWPVVAVAAVPDASRFPSLESACVEAPETVEQRLSAFVAGVPWRRRQVVVCDVTSPIAAQYLDGLPKGVRVQWRARLSAADLATVAAWSGRRPDAAIRLYYDAANDLSALPSFASLQSLSLDLRGRAIAGRPLPSGLLFLEIAGLPADIRGMLQPGLRALAIRGRRGEGIDAGELRGLQSLRTLDLSNVALANPQALAALPNLRALRLTRIREMRDLTWLAHLRVTHLYLRELTHLDDLDPVARMPALEHLEIRGAWQFGLGDVDWLERCIGLRGLTIDIGSRRKNAEIYRSLARPYAEPFEISSGDLVAASEGGPNRVRNSSNDVLNARSLAR